MRTCRIFLVAALAVCAAAPALAQSSASLKQAVPTDAHLAIYAQENAEREYQKAYMAEIWQTFQDERIVERLVEIVTSNAPEEELAQARGVLDELKAAAEPIDCAALTEADEFVYAQVMEIPFNHHLFGVKIGADAASEYVRGVKQLMKLAEEKSGGEISVTERSEGDATIVELNLPFDENMPVIPFHPAVAQVGDAFLVSDHVALLQKGISQLAGQGESKFADARLTEALATLPDAEDSIVFFDGEELFEKLNGIGGFISMASNGDPNAQRAAKIITSVISECDIIDYTVTVEYTEGNQNRTSTLGKLADDSEGKLLFKAVAQGQPFESWQSWAPADADAYALSTGVNMHVLYEGILEFVRDEVPESHEALDKWEAIQHEIGVHLDRDILQSFSGESVSITLPAKARDGTDTQHSVTALKCSNPERVRELIHKGFEGLNRIPAVQAQQLKLVPCEGLEGFDELQAPTLAMFGAAPVVGFYDGWMMMASNREAVERVIAVRKGEAPSIAGAESLQQFGLDVDGTVHAVKYTDIAKGIHQAAQGIEQVGAFLPMVIGMAGAQASPEELKPIQDVIGLLPSVAKVVRKFDFMEKSLNVTKEGPTPMTFVTDSSMIIRQPTTR